MNLADTLNGYLTWAWFNEHFLIWPPSLRIWMKYECLFLVNEAKDVFYSRHVWVFGKLYVCGVKWHYIKSKCFKKQRFCSLQLLSFPFQTLRYTHLFLCSRALKYFEREFALTDANLTWQFLVVHMRRLSLAFAFRLCCLTLCCLGFLVPFPHGVWGRKWNSIVSVPDHCLLIYFDLSHSYKYLFNKSAET